MSKSDDGGPAFPKTTIVGMNGEIVDVITTGGMSLRDYFAAKAMQAMIAKYGLHDHMVYPLSPVADSIANRMDGEPNEDTPHSAESTIAYEVADAMLLARAGAKKGEEQRTALDDPKHQRSGTSKSVASRTKRPDSRSCACTKPTGDGVGR